MTLEQKIQAGLQKICGKTILHTAPHHDDILLGYFPYLLRNLAGNDNHVLYLTSGANGVSDVYLAQHAGMTLEQVAELDHAQKIELKSNIRESESEKKWAMVADNLVKIKHLQAEFYKKNHELETKNSTNQDVIRIFEYLKQVRPDIITVLVDEPGCGPQTHHQAADLMFAAIAQYRVWLQSQNLSDDLTILGYRNIWSSFSVEQASMIVQVSQQELDQIESIFLECFVSQRNNLMMLPDSDVYDVTQFANFAQQTTWIMLEQGTLVGIDQPVIFLQKLPLYRL